MAKFLRIIDKASEYSGKTVRWVALGMIFATTYEVIARYFFNAPTQWAHQTVCSWEECWLRYPGAGFCYIGAI